MTILICLIIAYLAALQHFGSSLRSFGIPGQNIANGNQG
jgi:hypothetical protein